MTHFCFIARKRPGHNASPQRAIVSLSHFEGAAHSAHLFIDVFFASSTRLPLFYASIRFVLTV